GLDGTWAVGTDVLRFSGTVSDGDGTIATVQIKVGDGPWTDVAFDQAAATWQTAVQVPSSDGSTLSVQVRAIDLAGHVAVVGDAVAIDLVPEQAVPYVRPETTIESGPAASSSDTSAAFTFGSTGGDAEVAGFRCELDGNRPVSCAEASTFEDLAAGEHTLAVSAVDDGGYQDLSPVKRTFSVVAAGPQAIVSAQPAATTAERSAEFVFTAATGATFECALDGAPLAPCMSPQSFAQLVDGPHRFLLRTTLGGVIGTSAAFEWNVVNETPVANDQEIVVVTNDEIGRSVTLVAEDTDPITYRVVDAPRHGLLVGTPPNIAYVPFTDYVGSDAFSFVADDGQTVSGLGNVSVLVTDQALAPVISLPGSVVSANTDPGEPFATVSYNVTATDPDAPSAARNGGVQAPFGAGIDVICSPVSGSSFNIGDTSVTCEATDADNNTTVASFIVRVTDNENPVVVDAKNQTVYSTLRQASPADYTLPLVTDNSGSTTITCDPASGSTFELGKTTVNCIAADASGNTVAATFVVTLDASRLPDGGNGEFPLREAFLLVLAGLVLLLVSRRRRSALVLISEGSID
ncbi:MAG: hypothetical protein ACI8RE_003429, partial [Ilumatobacter sp.]